MFFGHALGRLCSMIEGPGEAASEGTLVPECMHSFPGGPPRQRQLQFSMSPSQVYSPPAVRKYLNDLCNIFLKDSEEKDGREEVREGRGEEKKEEEERKTKKKRRRGWKKWGWRREGKEGEDCKCHSW